MDIGSILNEDAAAIVVMQNADMNVVSTKTIAAKHTTRIPFRSDKWVCRTLGYNVAGDVVYIKNTTAPKLTAPSWVPVEFTEE